MSHRDAWAENYDSEHGRQPRPLQAGTMPSLLVQLQGLTGIKFGPAVTTRLERLITLHSALPEASARRADAEQRVQAAPKAQRAKDALAVIEALKGKTPDLGNTDFGADEVAEANADLAAAIRLNAAVSLALDTARRDLSEEVASDAFIAKLAKLWADRVAPQPTDQWTLGDWKAATAVADEVASVIEAVYLGIEGIREGVLDKAERARLREAFRATPRPDTMPTLPAIRQGLRDDSQNTPRAKALRAAEAAKAAAKTEADRLADSYRTDSQRERLTASKSN